MAGNRPPHVKVLRCPHCGGEVEIRAPGHSITAVCRSCGSIIDAANDENLQVIGAVNAAIKRQPHIPLGRRGRLHGEVFEVIGFMERCDGSGLYYWREYLLFNPRKGFRWLTEFDGHWNYVISVRDAPKKGWGDSVKRLGTKYQLFHRGTAKVHHVLGEFYWRVKVGDTVRVEDYIAPPEMLSLEADKQEEVWSVAQYIDRDDVARAFQVDLLPPTLGVAPNQPSSYKSAAEGMLALTALFLALLFGIQMFSLARARNETVYRQNIPVAPPGPPQPVFTSPSFPLPGSMSNVAIGLSAPVSNNWLEVEGELVNEATQQAYPFEVGVEYYSGHDSEGYWQEGSQLNDTALSSIPGGTYHLSLQPTLGYASAVSAFSVEVKRGVPIWSNVFLAFFALVLPAAFMAWLSHSFERRRWSTSDYSPYWSSEE